ncbi:MAG: LON peptidase substrate-binding domain-containing protein [Candidatus Dormibacteraeota bacterium]|nr:LON peptidase substrate-binding domain-containing protein [Candidatus Dormibacteraeota bacterium]
MAVQIPLFPLNAVLFPHMPMALHIFEERYRRMMHDCLEQGTTFGVIAIREGREIGPSAEPYEVGTLAQLRAADPLPDGRYNIVVVGASRFHVETLSRELPYLTGSVRYLLDLPAGSAELAQRISEAFRAYARTLSALQQNTERTDIELPDDPELLSYLVAAALQVSVAERQQLLEIDSTDERLKACLSILRRERMLLENMLGYATASSSTVPLN